MRLVDNLRKAEKKGAMSIRQGVDRAREEWADVERRIRQRMRIYPQKHEAAVAATDGVEDTTPESKEAARKAIISVHGRDIGEN